MKETPLALDSATVKQLLKEGGKPDGFSFTYNTDTSPVAVQVAQMSQSMLAQYAIQMKI